MVKKYRKKPVCIEAVQFTRNNWDEVVSFTNNTVLTIEKCINGLATCVIPTAEGCRLATENDFIIKGTHGEFYLCNPDTFEKTYEEVSGE